MYSVYICVYIYIYTHCVYSLPYPHTFPVKRAWKWHMENFCELEGHLSWVHNLQADKSSLFGLEQDTIYNIYMYKHKLLVILICINILKHISYIDMYNDIYIYIYIYTRFCTHTHACSVLPHRPCRCQNQKHWSFLSGVPRNRQDWGTPEGCQSLGSATTCTAPWPVRLTSNSGRRPRLLQNI